MHPADLALRFLLELTSLAGFAVGGWSIGGAPGVIAAVVLPLLAATAWGIFNVPGDPSRSGRAPVAVPGAVRLSVELAVLGGGAAGWAAAGWPLVAGLLVAGVLAHLVVSRWRLGWLLAHR